MKFHSNFWKLHAKTLSIQIFIVVVLCGIGYFWLDRVIALFMLSLHPDGKLGHYDLTDKLTAIAYFGAMMIMAFYAYMRIVKGKTSRIVTAAGGVSLAVPVAFFIKTELQYLFGRFAPRYGTSQKLIFMKHPNLYGFHFFTSGSFPSGHMCVFTATLLMISFYYPKFKPYAIAALATLAFLLLFYNYHFFSDVIAGTYIGYVIAWTIHQLQELEDAHSIVTTPAAHQEPHP